MKLRALAVAVSLSFLPLTLLAQLGEDEMVEAMTAAVRMAMDETGIEFEGTTMAFDERLITSARAGSEESAAAGAVARRFGAPTVARDDVRSCVRSGPRSECRFTDPHIDNLIRVGPPQETSAGWIVDVGIEGAADGRMYVEIRTVLVSRVASGSWRGERILGRTFVHP